MGTIESGLVVKAYRSAVGRWVLTAALSLGGIAAVGAGEPQFPTAVDAVHPFFASLGANAATKRSSGSRTSSR